MAGFCFECGQPLLETGLCDNGHTQVTTRAEAGRSVLGGTAGPLPVGATRPGLLLPKARPAPRLSGSGIEFLIYLLAIWVVIVFSLATGFGAGILGPLPICALVAIRDLRGGAYSLSKRVAGLRVVDARTGLVASNLQGLGRNSYYILLLLVMALPALEVLAVWPFKMLVLIDTLLALVNPQGRRLGDFIAGTQVVSVRQR